MPLSLPAHLQRILDAEYPRFSAAEIERRHAAIAQLLAAHRLDHLVYCGFNRTGSAVQWLTQWPVTAEAVGVFSPGKPDALFVQYFNRIIRYLLDCPLLRGMTTENYRAAPPPPGPPD